MSEAVLQRRSRLAFVVALSSRSVLDNAAVAELTMPAVSVDYLVANAIASQNTERIPVGSP